MACVGREKRREDHPGAASLRPVPAHQRGVHRAGPGPCLRAGGPPPSGRHGDQLRGAVPAHDPPGEPELFRRHPRGGQLRRRGAVLFPPSQAGHLGGAGGEDPGAAHRGAPPGRPGPGPDAPPPGAADGPAPRGAGPGERGGHQRAALSPAPGGGHDPAAVHQEPGLRPGGVRQLCPCCGRGPCWPRGL